MKIRKASLPTGWYPETSSAVEEFIEQAKDKIIQEKTFKKNAKVCVVPHAGWSFSGKIALSALLRLQSKAETLIVIGGHLGPSSQPLMMMDDGVETPLGILPIDVSFRNLLLESIPCKSDVYPDNTVEVQLPFLHYLFPSCQIIWMRLPAEMESYSIGKTIGAIAEAQHKNVLVIGSTDLTHYGPNYDFNPAGKGEDAYTWVTQVNDAELIQAVLAKDPDMVFQKASKDYAACSVGAILAAMGYSETRSLGGPELVAYGTSRDVHISDSFVGYASIIWQ